ncbi:hypothetical protein I5677_12775 [Mobilitalea sibirica]|uniref:Membrane protein YczE n=1 Tax=Mobilitalea sibirica TaxID=1462919 RepID=A0A8J7H098_9FIRM|nr:hypothetical protein [Mobilitalea sibirica]
MTKNSIRSLLLHILVLMVGLTIAHFGVTLFIQTNLGSDPYNVFVQGIYRSLQDLFPLSFLTHGYTHIFISFIVILILLVVNRSYIKIGTVLCMLFGGPIIDMFTFILKDYINETLPYIVRLIVLSVGCIILAFGMTIVIKSEAGTGPNDLVALVISDKIHKKFSLIRIIVDFTFVAVGGMFGGIFGIGTVICAFLVGPVAGIFLPINERLINKIYSRNQQ